MKWKKIGRIFDPLKYDMCPNGVGFAQSPQALPLKRGIRIFFSTREKQDSGKFLSHVSYADFTSDFKHVIQVAEEPVISLGGLGAFDEHGIFPVHIMRNDEEVWAYTTGWSRRISVSADASIGLAISDDSGESFTKFGTGPILSASLNEPFLIGDPFVLKEKNRYIMWYIFGQRWIKPENEGSPERVYKIGCAMSKDGIQWQKFGQSIMPDVLGVDECQALPTVLKIGTTYHMIFCFRHAFDFREDASKAYRLGYARSKDGQNWERVDQELNLEGTPNSWDSDMQCYPHFFSYKNDVWLLYNGNNFGRNGFGLAKLEKW